MPQALSDITDPATAKAATDLTNAVQSTQVLLGALQRLDGEINAANEILVRATGELQHASAALAAAQRRRDEAAARLRAVALAGYVEGEASGLQRLADSLAGSDPGRSERMAALRNVARDSVERDYAAASKRLVAARRAHESALAQRDGALRARDAKVAERQRTQAALDSSQWEIGALRGKVNVGVLLQAGGGSIGALLAARQAGQLSPPIGPRFSWPLAVMHMSSPFGFRTDPITGAAGFHPGADFPQPTGTPIKAAADGVVVIAGPEAGYGNCTVIDHGDALGTLYGHQSAVIVRPGDVVKRGEVIGYVGSTGYSTGPHLHFEVRVLGKPVDPLPWIDPPLS